MASAIYNSFKQDIQSGTIDLDTDTIYVLLVTSGYTVNIDTHTRRSDVTASEATGTGYTAGGAAITSKALAVDTTNDRAYWDGADVTWQTSTITARGAVIYKSRGGAASADELIAFIDFAADKSSSAGDFTIQWATTGAGGIMYLS